MTSFNSMMAVFMGMRLCLSNKRLKESCFTPWLFGFSTYIIVMIIGIYSYPTLVSTIHFSQGGVWGVVLLILTKISISLAIAFLGMVIASIVVMFASSYYQYQIATVVLTDYRINLPKELKFLAEFKKSTIREISRLIGILPILVICFFLSFIPLLGLVSVLLGAWLVAFPFFDIALETSGASASNSIHFCLKNFIVVLVFGLTLLPFWVIPFAPVLLTPFATAGASWLIAMDSAALRKSNIIKI